MERRHLCAIAEEIARIGATPGGPLRQERLVQLVIDRNLSLIDMLAVMDIMESWGEAVHEKATPG